MKKSILSLLLFFVVLLGFTANAQAKDMTRRFGLGVDSTISKYATDGRGLSAIYVINKYFGMQLIFGVGLTKANVKVDNGEFDSTITDWSVSLRGLIPIVLSADVNLTGVVGFAASGRAAGGFKTRDEAYQQYNDGYQFSIDLGVRPEWFVSDHFSIHTQVGIGIDIITSSGSALNAGLKNGNNDNKDNGEVHLSTNASGVSVSFFKNVDLVGQAGFTFWF